MNKKRMVLAVICLLLFLSVGLAFTLRSSPQGRLPTSGPAAGNELIAGYRRWTRVNPEPARVEGPNAQLCAAPIPPPTAAPGSPHGPNKYITVYVNDIGRHAMMEEK